MEIINYLIVVAIVVIAVILIALVVTGTLDKAFDAVLELFKFAK